ncbi:unnamed protein product [Linum tenue]|uniref:Uncharacterized protein n=1 Tax=Linum tenue TaxID=586396 RepID=A0AAV0KUQ8_9ROSI|nr:unnamed protein product [Linum tenue]
MTLNRKLPLKMKVCGLLRLRQEGKGLNGITGNGGLSRRRRRSAPRPKNRRDLVLCEVGKHKGSPRWRVISTRKEKKGSRLRLWKVSSPAMTNSGS